MTNRGDNNIVNNFHYFFYVSEAILHHQHNSKLHTLFCIDLNSMVYVSIIICHICDEFFMLSEVYLFTMTLYRGQTKYFFMESFFYGLNTLLVWFCS